MRRLRVLVFTTVFPNPAQPTHGLFVRERIRQLAHLAEIRVVAPVAWYPSVRRSAPHAEVQDGLPVAHPTYWYVPRVLKILDGLMLFLSSVAAVRRLRRWFDFDLIDAHFAYPDGFAAVLLARLFRKPVCVTLRGTIIPLSADPFRRRLCDWAITRADQVIAVAENLAERARRGGVQENRLAIISNGVDLERFRPEDANLARRRLGLLPDAPLLVSVGHLSPRKGFQHVIRALPRLGKAHPGLRFAIIGGPGAEGDNGPQLRELACDLGVAERVIFAGPEPPGRVALWLAASHALVLASAFEGSPNVVLEALACGRPVVSSKVGNVERIVPEFAGILIDDPNDVPALSAALSEALRRTWDPLRIRSCAADHGWEGVANQVAARWRLCLSGYGRPSVPVARSGAPSALHPTSERER